MLSSSGLMKLRALAMAMNTSSFTRSGTPCTSQACSYSVVRTDPMPPLREHKGFLKHLLVEAVGPEMTQGHAEAIG